MKLFGYFRSSTSYRLRIALNLKGLDYEYVPVSLLKSEQKAADYVARDPAALAQMLDRPMLTGDSGVAGRAAGAGGYTAAGAGAGGGAEAATIGRQFSGPAPSVQQLNPGPIGRTYSGDAPRYSQAG